MINKKDGIRIKYLEGGIMYIWFFTDKSWIPYYLNPTCKKGSILIGFEGIDETEYIELSPEFDGDNYIILSKQELDQVTLVCIPKYKVGDAVPFSLKTKAAKDAA